MANFRQEKFNEGHAKCLALHLSKADYAELLVTGALREEETLEQCLIRCAGYSVKTYAIVNEVTGVTYAIGGFTETGTIWFLSSKFLQNFDKSTRKVFRGFLKWNLLTTLRLFDVPLTNYVWTGNQAHIDFIRSMGARMSDPMAGNNDQSFVKFEFHKEDFKEVL